MFIVTVYELINVTQFRLPGTTYVTSMILILLIVFDLQGYPEILYTVQEGSVRQKL